MKPGTPKPALTNQQRDELRGLLCERHDRLRSVFEDGVRCYLESASPGEPRRRLAEEHLPTAESIARMADQVMDRVSKGDGFGPIAELATRHHSALRAFRDDAQRAVVTTQALARRKPGPKAGDPTKRRLFCAWIGACLRDAGFELSTVPNQTWGCVCALLCDAA